MRLRTGNMMEVWGKCDLFLFTGNATITKDNRLVMGAGMAKTVKNYVRGIDRAMGDAIRYCYTANGGHETSTALQRGKIEYNLVIRAYAEDQVVGAFQVKHYWGSPAQTVLIINSCWALNNYIATVGPSDIHLNFPGIGNGGLARSDVLPIISRLPDCVTVWELP